MSLKETHWWVPIGSSMSVHSVIVMESNSVRRQQLLTKPFEFCDLEGSDSYRALHPLKKAVIKNTLA